jgi:hypothetical protein
MEAFIRFQRKRRPSQYSIAALLYRVSYQEVTKARKIMAVTWTNLMQPRLCRMPSSDEMHIWNHWTCWRLYVDTLLPTSWDLVWLADAVLLRIKEWLTILDGWILWGWGRLHACWPGQQTNALLLFSDLFELSPQVRPPPFLTAHYTVGWIFTMGGGTVSHCKHPAHCVVGCKERGGPYLRCQP